MTALLIRNFPEPALLPQEQVFSAGRHHHINSSMMEEARADLGPGRFAEPTWRPLTANEKGRKNRGRVQWGG